MQRPIISEETVLFWKNSDEEINKIIKIINESLNVKEKWKFYDPNKDMELSYHEVLNKIKDRYPQINEIEIMKSFIHTFPSKLKLIKNKLFPILPVYFNSIKQRLIHINNQEQYINFLEKELKYKEKSEFKKDQDINEFIEEKDD